MANWYGNARSNYFRVKDETLFREDLGRFEIQIITNDDGLFGLISEDEYGGWPSFAYSDLQDDETEPEPIDLVEVVGPHLAPGEVAVLFEIGTEKMRYLTGFAVAFNERKEVVSLNLDGIYELAKGLGENITTAEY